MMTSSLWKHVVVVAALFCAAVAGPGEQPETEGAVRLHGGALESIGNVLIFHEGTWGSVCDDGWNLQAAHVTCRMLGYSHALSHANGAQFGLPEEDIVMDDVRCYGDEEFLSDCAHAPWGDHDCDKREAAGVYCAPLDANQLFLRRNSARRTTTTTTVATTATTTATPTIPVPVLGGRPTANSQLMEKAQKLQAAAQLHETHIHAPEPYDVRLRSGRSEREGRVEVRVGGHWGAICSDHWTLLEATVVCQQLDKGYAAMAVQTSSFGGQRLDKIFAGIHCDGEESQLADCYHEQVAGDVTCSAASMVAGVVCSPVLPDLVPNATLVQHSMYLEDRPLLYLQCALEENCAAERAYTIKNEVYDWQMMRRRLLRFSSSTWNFGTAEFRPFLPKDHWEWHNCHAHYHSMSVFAHYDLLDHHGNKVAEGHKASFCLEDVECLPGRRKKFQCKGFADQGISVGCADNYLHDIDCQWIDVTEVKTGRYVFRMHINPELRVAELSYSNNAATCHLHYTGVQVYVTNCTLGMGL